MKIELTETRISKIWSATLAAVLACCLPFSSASEASSLNHPMRFEQISLDQGLSQSDVLAIWQDSRGLMWFGTENGLNSYDGYEFTHFKRERGNPAALASDFVYDIDEDGEGNLWIATNGGGLAKLDYKSGTFTSFLHDPFNENSISGNFVRRILIDSDGIIWLGTRGDGLSRLDPESGRFTHFRFGNPSDGQSGNPDEIHALHLDRTGQLWVGSNQGLFRLDTSSGEVEAFQHDAGIAGALSDHRVRSILEDRDGRLWVGTYGGGLNRLDAEERTFTHFRFDPADDGSIASDRVTSLFEDSDGRLWAGTSGGLNLVDREHGSFVRHTNEATDDSSLGDDAVTTIFQDRGDILWVGTRNRGLSKWNPRTWSFGLENARQVTSGGESQPNVTSFVVDPSGTLWIGTFGDGLSAINRNSDAITRYRHDPKDAGSLSDDRVMSLLLDADGMMWIGTMTGGVNRLDPATGEIQIFRHDPRDAASLSADGVMTLFQDSNGRVWAGTFGGGISRFDPATMKITRFQANPNNPLSVSSNRITSFAEDPGGKIWIGTDSGGLNLFDTKTETFLHYRHDPRDPTSLGADTVYSISVAADETVWVGTQGGGLDRIVGDTRSPETITFSNLSQVDGLPNDVIYGIEFDQAERLWISTNYGLSRLDTGSGEIKNLHRNDGLQSEEFNFGAHYTSADGEMFFGGHNGYNAFAPAEIKESSFVPPVVLTRMINSNDPVKSDLPDEQHEGVELGYKDDQVSFEFAALDFASSAENRYMYKLEGFDDKWLDLGNRRRVTYTDLSDGSYTLRVKAASSEGVWNEAGFSLPMTVRPAPWDTWWAYLCYLAVFAQLGLALWLGHKRKVRREEEYSLHLEMAVQQRTDQLQDRNKDLKQVNQALQESSLSDPLTGLRNRRFVFEEVARDLEVSRRKLDEERRGVASGDTADLVFMMIDLDNFKPINDTYGHAAGDQVLLEVRDLLLNTCDKSDFVVRWGGDEFMVIAKQARRGEPEALAERIRARIADHSFTLGNGQLVRTTCSIGFASFPLFRAQADDANLDQIVNIADNIMYEAKRDRNAWAGLHSPSEASASANFDIDSIEPTSMLFRARRAGKLAQHVPNSQYSTHHAENWPIKVHS